MSPPSSAVASVPPSSSTVHIVLTGASGYLGQHLLAAWMKDGDDGSMQRACDAAAAAAAADAAASASHAADAPSLKITALYRSLDGFAEAVQSYSDRFPSDRRHVSALSLDLTDAGAVQKLRESLPPRERVVVVHAAALSSPRQCQDDPDSARALNVPTHFFDAMRDLPLIALSTDQVYSGRPRQDRRRSDAGDGRDDDDDDAEGILGGNFYTERERDHLQPANVYGQTKLEMERFLTELCDKKRRQRRQQQQQRGQKSTPSLSTPPPSAPLPPLALLRSSIILGPPGPVCAGAHPTFLDFCQSEGRARRETAFFTNEHRSVVSVRHVVRVINAWIVKNVVAPAAAAEGEDDDDCDDGSGDATAENRGRPTQPTIFNMGGPNRVSRLDMARAVFDYFQYSAEYLVADVQTSATSPLDISMDSSLLLQSGFGGPHEPETLYGLVDYSFSAHEVAT